MINISINNNRDSNNYPQLHLDAGQVTIQIKLQVRKIVRVRSWERFQGGRKIGTVGGISPSMGLSARFRSVVRGRNPEQVGMLHGEAPGGAGGQREPFPGHPSTGGAPSGAHLLARFCLRWAFLFVFW